MKTLTTFRIIPIILFTLSLLSQTSCVVVHKSDNGKHKGWYKNPKNPHNPNSTNPGKSKGNSNTKAKGNTNGKSKGNSNGKSKK